MGVKICHPGITVCKSFAVLYKAHVDQLIGVKILGLKTVLSAKKSCSIDIYENMRPNPLSNTITNLDPI